MIHVPVDSRLHLFFDPLPKGSAALLAGFLCRWRLKADAAPVAARAGPTQLYHLYVDRPVGSTNVTGLLPA